MDYPISHIALGFISLIAACFFGGMEIVFLAANKLKIELDKKQGVFASGIIGYLSHKPRLFVSSMLIGKQLSFVCYTAAWWTIYRDFFLNHWKTSFLWTFTAILFFTLLFLIFSGFISKALFSNNPNRKLNLFALPLIFFFFLFFPVALILTGFSSLIRKFFSRKHSAKEEKQDFGRIDLDEYLEHATGNVDPSKDIDHEIQIFRNALDFSSVKARDCLIPRNEIIAIDITDSVVGLQRLFIESGVSKILVFRESIDHIIGYVHSFELFRKPQQIQHILRPISFIPEPMAANEILELFIKQKRNVVVVVDEFGGTAGIITMEDIVEEIFGEIEDEHDTANSMENNIGEGIYEFSARLEIDFLNEKYHLELPVNNEEYDTLGGLILYLTGDIPEENTRINVGDYFLTPLIVNEKMIELVRLELVK